MRCQHSAVYILSILLPAQPLPAWSFPSLDLAGWTSQGLAGQGQVNTMEEGTPQGRRASPHTSMKASASARTQLEVPGRHTGSPQVTDTSQAPRSFSSNVRLPGPKFG